MSGNTQDVPCKGSRFNNVITSNVVYIGQPNDAQPAKCPKTCAQRGSWANPARSTTEGLALALQYYQYNPTTLSFGFGDFDVGAGDITVPANISFVGSGNNGSGTNLNARSYTWVDVPPPNTTSRGVPATLSPQIANAGINASVTVSSTGGYGITIETATITPANLLLKTDASPLHALKIEALSNAKVAVDIINTTVTQKFSGATVMDTSAADGAKATITMNGSQLQALSGTISSVRASGSGKVDWTDANSLFEDLGTTPSSVSAFITNAKDNSSISFNSNGSITSINVAADVAGFQNQLSDSAALSKIEGNLSITNLGQGQLIQHAFADASQYSSTTSGKNVNLNAGPWYSLATPDGYTGAITIADRDLVANYSGTNPLTVPFAQTILTGGTYTGNDLGGSHNFATTAFSHIFTNSGAIATITSNSVQAINTVGGVYSANTTTAIANTDITTSNSAVTATGTNAVALTNSGTLTVTSNANNYAILGEIPPASEVATQEASQCTCYLVIFCSCTSPSMSTSSTQQLDLATPSTTISSSNDIFAGVQGISGALSVSGTGGTISSTINGATMNNVQTAVQSNLKGKATHTFTDVGSVYQHVGTVYDFVATEEASYNVGAATVIPQSLSTALASFTSTASNPSSATIDGAAYTDSESAPLTGPFITGSGNVILSGTNLQAKLQSASFYTGDHTLGTAAAFSGIRASQTGNPSQPPAIINLMSSDGTGSASISNAFLESANGKVIGADGLTNLSTTLSTLTTNNATGNELISVDNISGLVSLLSSNATNASGDLIRTRSAVKAELQAVASIVPPGSFLYNNTAPGMGLFQYAQSNGFTGSGVVKNAVSTAIPNTPITV